MPGDASRPNRDELVGIVRKLMEANGTEAELDELVSLFNRSVPHPSASDLIYYPEVERSADEIVDEALSYKTIPL